MVSYLAALVAIAIALSALMAGAWVVRDYTGNSGWVDTIWTFSVGLVGAASALWPLENAAPNARQWLVAALVAVWSLRLGTHIAVRTSAISDAMRRSRKSGGRPRRSEWGVSHYRMKAVR
jgi:steroid 5-alpha reductase family enzyme